MKPSQPKVQFQSAYKEVNFFESQKSKSRNNKPVLSSHNGPDQLSQMFSPTHAIQNQKDEIYLNAQPFYVGEVDHNIEEIGLMAVR